jgi:transcriptional regulator with XRE-family HTH domain
MTLDQYLSLDGNTAAALATRAGTTAASITRLLYGDQQPSADMVRSLVRATEGALTAEGLIFGAPRKRPTPSARVA